MIIVDLLFVGLIDELGVVGISVVFNQFESFIASSNHIKSAKN